MREPTIFSVNRCIADELLARIRASLRRKETFDRKVDANQQRLQSTTERKSHILTDMSHELRTKLDAIIGFSEILQEQFCGELNDQQAEYISYILTSGTDLLMGVNGLLEMVQIDIGEASLQLHPLPLRPSLETCLELVRGHAQAHAITLSLTVDETVSDVRCGCDATQTNGFSFALDSDKIDP
ncbi:hypothetical protein C2W62_37885 [Candidatus Entotheonella serta]|nr:hypothetical protein C2W62_37885 [Candidatus Entotheonella serta]